jgi:hypothetical protein
VVFGRESTAKQKFWNRPNVSLRGRGKGTGFFCYAASQQRPAVGNSKEVKKEVVPYTTKMLHAVSFEPTPRETDLDSVAAATRPRTVRWTCEETIHE